MLVVILAATLSVSQVLPTIEGFCTNAEIEIGRPATAETVTKQVIDEEHQRVQVKIREGYYFTWYKGKVTEFDDSNQNIHRRLTRSDPADMVRWSQQSCLIEEAGALEMATRIFRRLGYEEKGFAPPEAKQFRWIPSPVNPARFFLLPLFGVRWYQKGHSEDQPVPQYIELIISGTTRKLVSFTDHTLPENLLTKIITNVEAPNEEERPTLTPEEALPICEPFLKAIGARIDGLLREHAVLWRIQPAASSAQTGVEVDHRFVFEILDHSIYKFYDYNERPLPVLEARYPERLKEMAGEQCVLTETQALETAAGIFQRLGFREWRFSPPHVRRHINGAADPEKPGTGLRLPDSFRVEWIGRHPFWAPLKEPEFLTMEISGVTSNLIFFTHF